MKALLTNNLVAKLVSLALAILLWAVIRKSQFNDLTILQPKPRNIEFGATAYGEKK